MTLSRTLKPEELHLETTKEASVTDRKISETEEEKFHCCLLTAEVQ